MDKKSQRLRDLLRNNYPPLRTDSSDAMLDLNSNGSDPTYVLLRATEKTGIAGYFTGGDVGVIGKSVTGEIGVWGMSTADKAVAGTTDSGIGVYGDAATTGRGVVGTTASTTLGGVVARNTSTGPALVVEQSYAYFEEGLIVNGTGGSATTSDFRVAGDTNTHLIFTDASADRVGIAESIPNATLDVNGTTRLGDSDTNYLAVGATGLLTLAGSARYERSIQIDAKADGAVANQPTQVDFFTAGGLQYGKTGAKFAFCQWEIPDDWDGGNVYFEVDWFPDSGATSGTAAVRWTVEYRAIAEGELINNGTSVTVDNGAGGDTADYAQYQTKHTRFTLPASTGNQPLTKQDHVYFKVSRDTSVANNFDGSVTATSYEIIYTSAGFPTSN